MQFYLVDCRNHLRRLAKICQDRRVEISHADGLGQPFFIRLRDAAIRCEIIVHRLVQQDQIRIFHIQSRQRRLHRLIRLFFRAHIADPDLGRDEQILPRRQTVCNGTCNSFADSLLIVIRSRRIDQAIARFDGVVHHLLALLLIRDLKHAEPFLRHFRSCI